MTYFPLNESGDGSPFIRPKGHREHGTWFSIPHIYWTGEYCKTLDLPAKAMLLIALSMKEQFHLPQDRISKWYGISTSTAKRGLDQLIRLGIL